MPVLLIALCVGAAGAAPSAGLPIAAAPPPSEAAASGSTAAIPRDLPECFGRLDRELRRKDVERLRAGDVSPAELQRRFAPKVLNEWISPSGSPLAAYFRQLGIDHAQDMAGIVLTSYARHLRGQPVRLAQQIRIRAAYWQGLLTPEKVAAATQLWTVARSDEPLLADAYSTAATLVSQDFNGSELDHPLLSRGLVRQEWDALGEFLAWRVSQAQPSGHPTYASALAELAPPPSAVLVQLEPRTTVVAIGGSGIGHVMIFTALASGRVAVWHIGEAPPPAGKDFETLGCWSPAGYRGRPCSPGAVATLPDDARGLHRFYVDAGYAQAAGDTRGRQLSIWRWTGRTAEPLYVRSYVTGGDMPGQGASLDGSVIRIGMKGAFQTLDPCGACDGRQLVERLAVRPDDRVESLGTTSLTPELDLVDEIYTRVRQNRSVEGLASRAALAVIERSWQPMRGRQFHDLFFSEPQTVTHHEGRTQLCFRAYHGLDDPIAPILFTFEGTGSQLRISGAQEHASGCTARSG